MTSPRSIIIIYLFLVLILNTYYGESRRPRTFRGEAKYCGTALSDQLKDFCELFYQPTDLNIRERWEHRAIVKECCETPCNILYIILYYCKAPKYDSITSTFGKEALEMYHNMRINMTNTAAVKGTIIKDIPEILREDTTERNVRRKKHIRRHRRRKKRCKCKKDPQQIKKEKMLLSRTVPKYIIGVADYHENEPVLISNSL